MPDSHLIRHYAAPSCSFICQILNIFTIMIAVDAVISRHLPNFRAFMSSKLHVAASPEGHESHL